VIDPDPYNGARPYVCADCGRAMRTRGVDGRCYECMKPRTRVLCRGWKSSTGVPMGCAKPVMQEGEPGAEVEQGQCRVCAEMQRQAQVRRQVRAERQVRRNAARGYGGPAPGEDIWKGFREEE
jgi:hypothetical protein